MTTVPRCQSCGYVLEAGETCCMRPTDTRKRERDATEAIARALVEEGLASPAILTGMQNIRWVRR